MKLRVPRRAILTTLSLAAAMTINAGSASADFPGGFIHKSYDAPNRPRLSQSQIQNFVPSGRGKFTFPAPYNTEGVRITIPSDCGGTEDCLEPVGYSYWALMNNHVGRNTISIVLNLAGHGGPTLFSYDKATDAVTKVGPLFAA